MPTRRQPTPPPGLSVPEGLPPPALSPAARVVDSDRLFAGASELLIEHRGALYRLRQTSMGKLILTK